MLVLKKTYDAKVAADQQCLETLASARNYWCDKAKDWEAKYKKAVTDLAAQSEAITVLTARLYYAEPRAIKWDNSLKRSRDRKAAKRESVS